MTQLDEKLKSFNLKDDRFIHHLFDDSNDSNKKYILNVITKHLLHHEVKDITLISSLQVPEIENGKYNTLDILYELEEGSYLNIEMQQKYDPKSDKSRFQQYGHKLVAMQLHKGEDYFENTKQCFQVLFINALDKDDPCLIQCAKVYKDNGEDDHDYVIRFYVYLPYIKEVLKHKQLEELNEFELLVYLFYFGLTCDILKLDREVVKAMARVLDEYTKEYAHQLGEFRRQWILQKERKEREEELNRAREEARQEIRQKARQEELKNAKFTCIQLFNKFYPNNDDSFLNNLTLLQYKLIFKALLEDQTLNQIQSLLHTYTKNS